MKEFLNNKEFVQRLAAGETLYLRLYAHMREGLFIEPYGVEYCAQKITYANIFEKKSWTFRRSIKLLGYFITASNGTLIRYEKFKKSAWYRKKGFLCNAGERFEIKFPGYYGESCGGLVLGKHK